MATVTPVRLGPNDHGRKMTLDEFLDAEEEPGYRYELARGVLEVTEVPDDPHADLVCQLLRAIAAYDRDHPNAIHRWGGSGEFRLWLPGMESGRNPDVGVILHNAPKDYRNRRIPALAMEVVSEGDEARDRDYVTKREEYLAYGLFEYWIIDPFAHTITVWTRRGDTWAERLFTDDQTATEDLVLPGFAVPLAELWTACETD